jgi:hypothetical protein
MLCTLPSLSATNRKKVISLSHEIFPALRHFLSSQYANIASSNKLALQKTFHV